MISVLYVDDEPDLLDLGRIYMERTADLRVTTAESAPAAIELLGNRHFDAIISDVQMPKMDGIEFLREVRQSFGTIPFIFFTERRCGEVETSPFNPGADHYLQKTVDPRSQFTELSDTVRHEVRRRETHSRGTGSG